MIWWQKKKENQLHHHLIIKASFFRYISWRTRSPDSISSSSSTSFLLLLLPFSSPKIKRLIHLTAFPVSVSLTFYSWFTGWQFYSLDTRFTGSLCRQKREEKVKCKQRVRTRTLYNTCQRIYMMRRSTVGTHSHGLLTTKSGANTRKIMMCPKTWVLMMRIHIFFSLSLFSHSSFYTTCSNILIPFYSISWKSALLLRSHSFYWTRFRMNPYVRFSRFHSFSLKSKQICSD